LDGTADFELEYDANGVLKLLSIGLDISLTYEDMDAPFAVNANLKVAQGGGFLDMLMEIPGYPIEVVGIVSFAVIAGIIAKKRQ
jgi:hypothetical protein